MSASFRHIDQLYLCHYSLPTWPALAQAELVGMPAQDMAQPPHNALFVVLDRRILSTHPYCAITAYLNVVKCRCWR